MGKFLLVIVLFAALVYTLLWLLGRRRGGGTPTRRTRPVEGPTPRRPMGPDDDEDFLRELERRHRKEARENKKKPVDPDGPTGASEA